MLQTPLMLLLDIILRLLHLADADARACGLVSLGHLLLPQQILELLDLELLRRGLAWRVVQILLRTAMLTSWEILLHRSIDLLDPPMLLLLLLLLLLLTDDHILPDLHGLLQTTRHIADDAISVSLVHLHHLQIGGLLLRRKVHHAMIWIRGLLDRWLLQSLLPRMVCSSDLLVDPLLLLILRIVLLPSAARLLIIEVVVRLRLHGLIEV